ENILFVEDFMTRVADLAERSTHGPLVSNTWGDGIFMVFETVTDGGLFALDLADLVESVSWEDMGLSRDLSIRIGLHAGPVHRCIDPVTSRPNYYGVHVGYAARLEPITAPGHVYASRQFAAVAACNEVTDFGCDYVGRVPFSKGYGVFPTYHVRRV
ncbi:adenylate cyclase, partial [Candidatus Fermentibacteria bacterium]|nr:adenylate cyclase [Candidatus Fermentibacteria bacterium]